ncbi:YdbH domain-containing protein [Pseudomonas lalucatii]|nr:YdbH domain-containing protein [Pseudomonas lalucatii]
MLSRRLWLPITCLLLVLTLLAGYGYAAWLRLLERQHIHRLDWQSPGLGRDGLHLGHLELLQQGPAGELHLQVERLHLGWDQLGIAPPFWQQIEAERLSVSWHPAAEPSSPDPAVPELRRLTAALSVVPHSLRIDRFSAELPCARGRCTLHGDALRLARERSALALHFNIREAGKRLAWSARLRNPADELALQLALAVDDHPQLELNSSLQANAEGLLWRGELSAPALSEAATLRDWLAAWGCPRHAAAQPAGQRAAVGPLAGTAAARRADRGSPAPGQRPSGRQRLAPRALAPPGIGRLQGDVSLAARSLQGRWSIEQLAADLDLQEPLGDWQRRLPQALRSDSLRLRIAAGTPLDELPNGLAGRALPLALELRGRGPSPFELRATLALANAPPWALQLTDARLAASTPQLAMAGWAARQLDARLNFDAYLDERRLNVQLQPGSRLQIGTLSGHDLSLEGLDAGLAGLQLRTQLLGGAVQGWQLEGPGTLSSRRLSQPALKPQGWQWRGRVQASAARLESEGLITAESDLNLPLQLHYDGDRGLHAHAQLPELFLRAGNPLAKTLAAWPALLELSKGRLSARASLDLAPGAAPDIRLDLSGKGLAGLYDRTALGGLDAQAQVRVAHGELQVELTELRLAEADPGIPLGPCTCAAATVPPCPDGPGPTAAVPGRQRATGGSLHIPPGQWSLKQDSLLLPLQLRGLRLERLFTLYPAEGLAGSGVLDGQLPLTLGPDGLRIAQGQLAARAPGGRLQFRSERMQALGRSNPAMQLVTQSLEDFRFTTLRSRVDYDPQGKLLLAMRLEGQNPAIEQGRPIHFNINLEEDIPTLLASLQLTDKVNEIIRRRVQQRILERRAATAPKEP